MTPALLWLMHEALERENHHKFSPDLKLRSAVKTCLFHGQIIPPLRNPYSLSSTIPASTGDPSQDSFSWKGTSLAGPKYH